LLISRSLFLTSRSLLLTSRCILLISRSLLLTSKSLLLTSRSLLLTSRCILPDTQASFDTRAQLRCSGLAHAAIYGCNGQGAGVPGAGAFIPSGCSRDAPGNGRGAWRAHVRAAVASVAGVCARAYMYICTYVHMYICTYVHMCMYIYV